MFYIFKKIPPPLFQLPCFLITIILPHNENEAQKEIFFPQQLELPWQHPRSQIKFGPVLIVTFLFVVVLGKILHVKSTFSFPVNFKEMLSDYFRDISYRISAVPQKSSGFEMTQPVGRELGMAVNTKSCLCL